jgi:hypothetical protein
MPNLILTAEGWESRVRNRLGVDDAYLIDADIAQPDIISVAEANIIEQVPGYAALTGSKRTWLEAATVCECAVLLCPSMAARLPTREQGPHFTREVVTDWDKKRQDLEAERDSHIAKIVDLVAVPHFGLSQ